MAGNFVYLVEFKGFIGGEFTTDTVHIASNLDHAVEWIKKNKDYSNEPQWWWAVYPMAIDGDFAENAALLSGLKYFDQNGNELDGEPVP